MAVKSINGLNERLNGMERLLMTKIDTIIREMDEIKIGFKEFRESEIIPMKADIERNKKIIWRATGALGVIVIFINILLMILKSK